MAGRGIREMTSVFIAASDSFLFLNNPSASRLIRFVNPSTSSSSIRSYRASPKFLLSQSRSQLRRSSCCCNADSTLEGDNHGTCLDDDQFDDIFVEIEKVTRNSRRIQSRIAVDASLDTIWNVLTDYERLADFFPGLAVSQLLEKRPNFARLFQVGQQDLAFGVKFNAKVIVECYEKDLQTLPSGKKRDIEFNMIEGDFQIFQGRWSIEQGNGGSSESSEPSIGRDSHSILSYTVNLEPKLWLPVGLVEGRLCREIKTNLLCVRREARKTNNGTLSVCS